MANLVGSTLLDRYFLRKHIGSGGMADVYMAWDTMRSARMAIKILRRDLAASPKFYEMFKREAAILRNLEHPSIARIYEFDKEGDIIFLVMELVDGSSLKESIDKKKKPFTTSEISDILQPICSALYYGHQKEIYHCDVKPANILINKTGQVYLTDFGVARISSQNMAGGTPPYMAPEQFSTGNVDAKTDVYALGITLFELLSGGYVPYRGDDPGCIGSTIQEKIKWEHLNLPTPSIKGFNSSVSSPVESVISTSLSKDPKNRFQTTMKFRDAFEHAKVQSGPRKGNKITNSTAFSALQQSLIQSEPKRKRSKTNKQSRSSVQLIQEIHCSSGDYAGKNLKIISEGLWIGRSSRNQIRIAEKSVSRMHAVIYITQQGTYIRDENSSMGTLVNGKKITTPTLLNVGDVIQIGYHQIFEIR